MYWLNYYFDLIWLYFSSIASFITELYATVTISKTDVTVKPLCTTSAVLLLFFFYFKYTFLVKRWLCCNWISFKVFLCKEKNPALWYLWLMWRKLVIYRKWLMIRVGLFNGNKKTTRLVRYIDDKFYARYIFPFLCGFFFLATAETTYVTLSNDRSIVDYKAIVCFYIKK